MPMEFRRILACIVAACAVTLAGCASGAAPYRAVSLKDDLPAETLARYREEMAAIPHADMRPMMTIESTNGWPLGLLAYWRKGVVEAIMAPGGGHVFMVSESRGYGPLSIGYVRRESATFDAEGRRLTWNMTGSVLWGLLLQKRVREIPTGDGRWLMDGSIHMLLDLLNWRATGRGPAAFWLFGEPGPIGWGG